MSEARRALGVVLIGYRASGKSTVGRMLAERLGLPFVDTDALLRQELGMEIAEFFARFGEVRFRDRESEVLAVIEARAAAEGPLVVATGGGIVLRRENTDRLRRLGEIIWLRARPETLRTRLAADVASGSTRPPLAGSSAVDEVDTVLAQRTPLYAAAAAREIVVDPPRTPADVVEDLVVRGGRDRS